MDKSLGALFPRNYTSVFITNIKKKKNLITPLLMEIYIWLDGSIKA